MTTAGPLVLVVEDEPPLQKFLRTTLTVNGYRVNEAGTVAEARRLLTSQPPEVVLLDLGLPDGDGISLTRELRGWSKVPVIVLSARGQETDKVEALDAGADDYLTKPFGVSELLARLRVALRHANESTTPTQSPVRVLGQLQVDLARRTVTLDGNEVHLTPIEYRLLTVLLQHQGKVLTHRQLLKEVWGPNAVEQTHYLRVHMANLRRKIEVDAARPRLLMTEPAVGYRLRDSEPTETQERKS